MMYRTFYIKYIAMLSWFLTVLRAEKTVKCVLDSDILRRYITWQ
jgi:hypothetical protein